MLPLELHQFLPLPEILGGGAGLWWRLYDLLHAVRHRGLYHRLLAVTLRCLDHLPHVVQLFLQQLAARFSRCQLCLEFCQQIDKKRIYLKNWNIMYMYGCIFRSIESGYYFAKVYSKNLQIQKELSHSTLIKEEQYVQSRMMLDLGHKHVHRKESN